MQVNVHVIRDDYDQNTVCVIPGQMTMTQAVEVAKTICKAQAIEIHGDLYAVPTTMFAENIETVPPNDTIALINCLEKHATDPSLRPHDFVLGMSNQHRTHQQTFTRLCFAWIRHVATFDLTQDVDSRNRASALACKTIVERCENEMETSYV